MASPEHVGLIRKPSTGSLYIEVHMRYFAALCLLALSGCAAGGSAGGVVAIVAASAIHAPAAVSDIAKAGCAAQAAANLASDVALAAGNTAWVTRFADVSKLAGIACAW